MSGPRTDARNGRIQPKSSGDPRTNSQRAPTATAKTPAHATAPGRRSRERLVSQIRNIIFDWSGTLVDDLPAVLKATNYVLSQAEREEMSLDQFRAEFSLPFTSFYDRHLPHIPLPQLEIWFHSHFKQVQDSVCALPHARDF